MYASYSFLQVSNETCQLSASYFLKYWYLPWKAMWLSQIKKNIHHEKFLLVYSNHVFIKVQIYQSRSNYCNTEASDIILQLLISYAIYFLQYEGNSNVQINTKCFNSYNNQLFKEKQFYSLQKNKYNYKYRSNEETNYYI